MIVCCKTQAVCSHKTCAFTVNFDGGFACNGENAAAPPCLGGVRGGIDYPPGRGAHGTLYKAFQQALQTPNSLVYCTLHPYPSTSSQCLKNIICTPMGIYKHYRSPALVTMSHNTENPFPPLHEWANRAQSTSKDALFSSPLFPRAISANRRTIAPWAHSQIAPIACTIHVEHADE